MASSAPSKQPSHTHMGSPPDLKRYLAVYEATMKGDWERAQRLFAEDEDALTAYITPNHETLLHRAVGRGRAIDFVEKLVELMPTEALALKNKGNEAALSIAVRFRLTEAATILVDKNPALLLMENIRGYFPIHLAALYAHKDTVLYLMKATVDHHHPTPYPDQSADMALDLVNRYPNLATFMKVENDDYPLNAIARKASAFPSGYRLNFWQLFIYSLVPVKLENYPYNNPNAGDIEIPTDNSQDFPRMSRRDYYYFSVPYKLHVLLAKVMESVPHIQHIRERKMMHHQALQLVKCLCKGIYSFINDSNGTWEGLWGFVIEPLLQAARLGIHEVIEELVDTFPDTVCSVDGDGRYIFQIAVINRNENVFNLLYQMTENKQFITNYTDNFGNTIYIALGWKEVEKFVIPAHKERENNLQQTPTMVFSEEHKELVIEGEKWMKDTANSCTISAALIATVVFAAAITVPGGNNEDGLPIFSKEIGFIIFAVSDAILTSRYAEQDFLYNLPKRLIISLVTLFLSITTMMITFSATLYLVFAHKKSWILVLVAALACLPVTLFVSLRFPLLVDVISSTYGPGIFGRQSERVLP